MTEYELAQKLFARGGTDGTRPSGTQSVTTQVHGYATTDSENGSVSVVLYADAGGDDAEMEVPTMGGITEGSDVLVTLLDGTPVDVTQSGNVDAASSTATKYITETNDNGITVHPSDPNNDYDTLVDALGVAIRKAAEEIVRMSGEVDAAGRRIGHLVVGDSSDGSATALEGTAEDVDYGTYVLRRRTSSLRAYAPDGSDNAMVSAWAETSSDGSVDECGVRLYGEYLNLAHGTTYGSVPMVDAAKAVAAQSGTVQPSTGVPAGSASDLRSVTFPTPYDSAPNVVVGFISTTSAGGFGRCSVAVNDISATGFTYRIFNGDTTARNPGICWIAL